MDGLALLKIVKHCTDALPSMVAGSLLGLDMGDALQVTHSFPFPTTKEGDTPDVATDGQDYQMEMMKMLREVNVDNNTVGWYQSMYLGSFFSHTLIDNQFSYQENLSDNSVVILYDPVQTSNGSLTIKAFRLTKEFMTVYREKKNEYIRPGDILEEIPIYIKNPGILNALVYELHRKQTTDCDFERLDLSTNPYLEKNLEFLCSWIDDLGNEQWKFQNYARNALKFKHEAGRISNERKKKINDERRAAGQEPLANDDPAFLERKPEPPGRLEGLLISNQINTYCGQINKFAGASFEKLFLAGSLQKESA
ncbi:unnamed protein product [Chrysoparadoxa australica]